MSFKLSRRNLLAASLAALPVTRLAYANSPAVAAKKPSAEPIRLVANENPYGPSPMARVAIEESAGSGWKYAFSEANQLRQQLAEFHGVDEENIVVTAGSGEALKIAALHFCQKGGKVVAARPTFNLITSYAETLGCGVDWVDLDSSQTHDLDSMAAAVGPDTRLVYICNPNNPTGTLLPATRLQDFLASVSKKTTVVVDEAYLDLHEEAAKTSAISNVLAGDPVVVMRTFSKIHGMAGMRIGYAIAAPQTIQRFEQLRMSFMNYPGVAAARASLRDTEFLDFSRQKIQQCMSITTSVLDELGLAYTPSYGNFVLFDSRGPVEKFSSAMLEAGIRTGRPEPAYPGWARISMGKAEDMELLAADMRRYYG